jgi:uncharacterized protein YbjT (DUF2867 family)
MKVAIAGGHGKIALRLARLLSDRGDEVLSLVRNEDHFADVTAAGGSPVLCDLEDAETADVADAIGGGDAVVFAAGAGPGSGAERKRTVDYEAAVKLIDAGVRRYVMVSAISAGRPQEWSEPMRPYYEAKANADERLAASGLDYTIVRPGGLTDGPGTGRVTVGTELERGSIPRDDVAAVLLAVLETPSSIGKTFELVSGETPVEEAVRGL